MARQNGDFDDDEGFFESLMRRKDAVPMPDSMMSLFKLVAAGAVLLIVGLVAWAVWPGQNDSEGGDVPVVHADSSDYKVKPDEPGGMPIPNKDSTIFESMETAQNAKDGERKVENLLEDDEQPMKKEEVFNAASAEETPAAPSTETLSAPPSEATAVKPEVKEEIKEEEKTEAKVESKAPVKEEAGVIATLKEEAGTADKEKKTEVKATEKPKAKGSVYIQLASVKSDADAKAKWSKLQSSFSSLKSLSLRVQKADLGEKGVFYRVQAGPLSAEEASSVCTKIKAAGGACLIAK